MVLEFLYNNPAMASYFLMPKGILAALALIPLILLYLIRPKPRTRVVPSLMFLMRQGSKLTKNAFFRALLRDLLIILQVLALLLFTLAIMRPYVSVSETVLAQHSVIVLDASASMQTKVGSTSRWDRALEIAKDNLGSTNTIILAGASPEVLLENAGASEAKSVLRSVQPKETITNLYDAVLLAGEKAKDGKVVIISDFIDTDTGTDILTAENALQAKGLAVQLESVLDAAKNVGIIDVSVSKDTTKITVKNYNDEQKKTTINIGANKQELVLEAQAVETASFPTPPGITRIILEVSGRDDLTVDNEAFISAPQAKKFKALYVTNQDDKYLLTVLRLIGIEVEIARPPQIPSINHDIVIFRNVDKKLILPGTFKDALKQAKEKGATVIVSVQQDTPSIDYRGLVFFGHRSKNKHHSNTKVSTERNNTRHRIWRCRVFVQSFKARNRNCSGRIRHWLPN
ncbi:MAG: BatA and WFA domain-containing protein, partial [Candidatus Woesearchaeota archaeon]